MKIRIIVIVLIIGLSLISAYFIPGFLKIQKIECLSQFGQCNQELGDYLNKDLPKTYKRTKIDIAQTLEGLKSVENYSINYFPPNTLRVNVIMKEASVALRDKGGNIFIISEENQILSKVENTDLPVLEISSDFDNEMSQEIIFSLEILKRLNKARGVNNAKMEEGKLIISSLEGYEVIFPVSGDIDYLLGALEAVITQLNQKTEESKIETESVRTIDLRFKNPIIR